jgi:hypothetical protein
MEYVVEAILGEKLFKQRNGRRKTRFLVKWEGYDEPTWEPSENLSNCQEKIDAYRASNHASTRTTNNEVSENHKQDDEETKENSHEDVFEFVASDNEGGVEEDENDGGHEDDEQFQQAYSMDEYKEDDEEEMPPNDEDDDDVRQARTARRALTTTMTAPARSRLPNASKKPPSGQRARSKRAINLKRKEDGFLDSDYSSDEEEGGDVGDDYADVIVQEEEDDDEDLDEDLNDATAGPRKDPQGKVLDLEEYYDCLLDDATTRPRKEPQNMSTKELQSRVLKHMSTNGYVPGYYGEDTARSQGNPGLYEESPKVTSKAANAAKTMEPIDLLYFPIFLLDTLRDEQGMLNIVAELGAKPSLC